MMRDAGHRHARTFGDVAPGQHNVELARYQFGVGVKCFVEIAQAKKQNRVRIFFFDVEILLADGGDFGGHWKLEIES